MVFFWNPSKGHFLEGLIAYPSLYIKEMRFMKVAEGSNSPYILSYQNPFKVNFNSKPNIIFQQKANKFV
jgi:hypothetical protein